MTDEKKPWTDLGAVTCHETNARGVKLKSKKGDDYKAGTGVLTVNGQLIRVYVTVFKGGRSGEHRVTISTPPVDDNNNHNNTNNNVAR